MTFRFCLSPDLFATLFPFHLVFDRHLSIIQVGSALHLLDPLIIDNKDFRECFIIVSPKIDLSFEDIRSHINSAFSIALQNHAIELKGQMLYVEADDIMLFIGKPAIEGSSMLDKDDLMHTDSTTDLRLCQEPEKTAVLEAQTRSDKLAEIHAELIQEQELNKLKTRFIHTASHEFRTPLGIISSSAGLLEDYGEKLSAEKKRKHFKQIQGSVKHMTTLLEDILLIEQADAGKLEVQKSAVDLIEFCHELVDEIGTSNDAEDRFAMNITTSDPTIDILDIFLVWVDRKLVRQILFNLLSNALKYSFPESQVRFEVQIEFQNIRFQIIDRGIGITVEDRVKLFESFHRGSNVSNIQGTGLGLSIVKRCVNLHGGTIELTSEVNVGSTFTVNLPIDDLEQPLATKSAKQLILN